jgi:hypothetical protein
LQKKKSDFLLFIIKDVNDWFGPPNNNGVIKEVTINPDSTCGNGWVCEHRWRQIRWECLFTDNPLTGLLIKFFNVLKFNGTSISYDIVL